MDNSDNTQTKKTRGRPRIPKELHVRSVQISVPRDIAPAVQEFANRLKAARRQRLRAEREARKIKRPRGRPRKAKSTCN